MKLFTASQIKSWDKQTISRYYQESSELMELAAQACADYLEENDYATLYMIFCGTGNNGGDGLAIGRLLKEKGIDVRIFIAGDAEHGSEDFRKNLDRVLQTDIALHFLSEADHHFDPVEGATVLDCIFGTGLNRPVEGWIAEVIESINLLLGKCVAIDVPSGLISDMLEVQSGPIVRADLTLTFQIPKRAMLFRENEQYTGNFKVLDIGLDHVFEKNELCDMFFYDLSGAVEDYIPRGKYDHKNTHGHVQVIAGSEGKMGAAVLCSYAALRSGAGLVTGVVPQCGLNIMQSVLPEAMCVVNSGQKVLEGNISAEGFSSTACGPGIGTDPGTVLMFRKLLKGVEEPLVLDADALNIIAAKKLFRDVPRGSVLTPHVGEFDRLFGKHENSFARFETARKKSAELSVVIVLKGAHTLVAMPDGSSYFNSTGNPAMATAGSGDVLTGIIGSMLAQGYSSEQAARLGVYLHGLAGDLAAEGQGPAGMIARDIIEYLPEAIGLIDDAYSMRSHL